MNSHAPLMVVVGTRAEAIKLLPVYHALKEKLFNVVLCATSQHKDLLKDVFSCFNVIPDFDLDVMKDNQDLFHITTTILEKIKKIYLEIKPQLVIVHGDTTTTMASALAAFYLKIPVAHVEAGLRTGDKYQPFPEEMNRKMVGQLATYHFTPTAVATGNLFAEGVSHNNVFCTGNTVVDSLFYIKNKIFQKEILIDQSIEHNIAVAQKAQKKIVLFTAHRRESFSEGILKILRAIGRFAQLHTNVVILYPHHPNPFVQGAIKESCIADIKNIIMMNATSYSNLVFMLNSSHFVVTDSGGIQEEAVSLGKPVICLRDVTERKEGIWDGLVKLVGTDEDCIENALAECYYNNSLHATSYIYGDGNASHRIATILKSKLFPLRHDTKNTIAPFYKKNIAQEKSL